MTPSKAPLPFLGTWKLTKCESSRPLSLAVVMALLASPHLGNHDVYSERGRYSLQQ